MPGEAAVPSGQKRWKIFKAAKMKKEFNFIILVHGYPKRDIKVGIHFIWRYPSTRKDLVIEAFLYRQRREPGKARGCLPYLIMKCILFLSIHNKGMVLRDWSSKKCMHVTSVKKDLLHVLAESRNASSFQSGCKNGFLLPKRRGL